MTKDLALRHKTNINYQISPFRVHRFNQSIFLRSCPTLQLLFTYNCCFNICCTFIIDQFMHMILLCKSRNQFLPVFHQSSFQMIGHPHIQDMMIPVRQDIHIIVSHAFHHASGITSSEVKHSLSWAYTLAVTSKIPLASHKMQWASPKRTFFAAPSSSYAFRSLSNCRDT